MLMAIWTRSYASDGGNDDDDDGDSGSNTMKCSSHTFHRLVG